MTAAAVVGGRVRVTVTGNTDDSGIRNKNINLALERARRAIQVLSGRGLGNAVFRPQPGRLDGDPDTAISRSAPVMVTLTE